MLILENYHFNYSNLNVKLTKNVILYENRSNFLRSERLQEIRIKVSFMLSLSYTDTITIIKRKLLRTNTIGHSFELFNSFC